MELREFFGDIWGNLSKEEQTLFLESARLVSYERSTVLKNSTDQCEALYAVTRGILRVYMISEEGREVTLYQLKEGDFCLFSASCILSRIPFPLLVEAQTDVTLYRIPAQVYQSVLQTNIAVSNFTSGIMSNRLADILWLVDQILFKRMDSRIAAFLCSQSELYHTDTLTLTHEQIAAHLGTAREVVSRMLKYLQSEQMITLSRKEIRLTDKESLSLLAGDA